MMLLLPLSCTGHPGMLLQASVALWQVLVQVLRPGWVRKGDAVRVFKAGRENKQIVQGTNEKGVYLSEAKEGDNGT